MNWISVESGLPDDIDQECIVWMTDDYFGEWAECAYTYEDYEWWDNEGQTSAFKVTHWMPITPPEAQG